MNKEYIKELFEENKEIFKEYELSIETPEELENFMIDTLISNMEYDFHIAPDVNKLFNKNQENNKELINEEIDIEK
ncbi:MAG: hypothetical protein IJD92_01020 [Bacilli bacterium]|nr:hypothetical protein [Bacilli bacterium]MBQ3511797.1 hypothetical protein [Bacilli bacterium]